METPQPRLGSMRAGLFEIDLDAGELSKSGRKVGLQSPGIAMDEIEDAVSARVHAGNEV